MKCECCNKDFSPKASHGRFCSRKCRLDGWLRQKEQDARVRWLLEEARKVLVGRGEKTPLLARVEEAVEESRETLAGQKTESR